MIPSLTAQARTQYGVFTTEQALTAGYGDDELKRHVRNRGWIRLRRGVFTDAATWDGGDEDDRHLMAVAAIQVLSSRPVAASHWTAALAHGLPLIRPRPDRPQVTANREHFRAVPGARLFNGALHAGHTIDQQGLVVTTVARTISDVARTHALDDALVMLEHALRLGLVSESAMRRVVADCPTWRGIAWTKRALLLVEPLNESPGETLSLLRMREHGIVLPQCQVVMAINSRRYRLDYLWREGGVVGEFDGRLKYASKDDVYAEKRREDDLRSIGLSVARWGWSDVQGKGEAMAASIQRAFQRAAGGPPIPWERYLAA